MDAARLALVGLLFASPWMTRWLVIARPTGNIFQDYTDFILYPADVLALLTLGLWAVSLLLSPHRLRRGPWYLTFPLIGLVIMSWLSALTGVDPALTLYHSVRFTALLALYFFLVNADLKPAWVIIPLALAVFIQGSVAIAQYGAQRSVGLYWLGELGLDPRESGPSILRDGDMRILRAYGLTQHPNLLGGFLAFAFILILGYYFEPAHGRARYFLLAPLAVAALGLFFSFSRSAVMGLAVALVAAGALIAGDAPRRGTALRDAAILALVLAGVLVLPVFNGRQILAQRIGLENAFILNSNESRSLTERDALVDSANRLFYARQILGVGNGALPLAMYLLDPDFRREFYYQPAHVTLLDAAAELGIAGGFLWLWLMVAPALIVLYRRRDFVAAPWRAAVFGAVLVMLVVGFVDYYPWLTESGRIWQWSAWGLFAAAINGNGVSRNPG